MAAGEARTFRYECVDSTNARALAALEAGSARHRDRHLARRQSAGRGQRGRRWESPAGGGLYLSLVWIPTHPPPASPVLWTMASGLACLDLARGAGLQGCRLKWPNDLVVTTGGAAAKLAGVLIESRSDRPGLVIGVGFNVGQREFSRSLEDRRAVSSLAREGIELDLERAEADLLEALEKRLAMVAEAPQALCDSFLKATGLAQHRVRVRTPHEERSATLLALCPDGSALLQDQSGPWRVELAHLRALTSR